MKKRIIGFVLSCLVIMITISQRSWAAEEMIGLGAFQPIQNNEKMKVLDYVGEGQGIDSTHSFHPMWNKDTSVELIDSLGKTETVQNTSHFKTGTFLRSHPIGTSSSVTVLYKNVGTYEGEIVNIKATLTSDDISYPLDIGIDKHTFLEVSGTKSINKQGHFFIEFAFLNNHGEEMELSGYWTFSGLNKAKILRLPNDFERGFVMKNSSITYSNDQYAGTAKEGANSDAEKMTLIFTNQTKFSYSVDCFWLDSAIEYVDYSLTNIEVPAPEKIGKQIDDFSQISELYTIKQTIPFENKVGYFNSFSIEDDLNPLLLVEAHNIRVTNHKNEDVTQLFNIFLVDNHLRLVAKDEELKKSTFYSSTYEIHINGKFNSEKSYLHLITDNMIQIPNIAKLSVDGIDKESNEAFIKIPSKIILHVQQIIIEANHQLVVPSKGYIEIKNVNTADTKNSTVVNEKIFQSVHSNLKDKSQYTTINLYRQLTGNYYQMEGIIPEYYQYKGYVVTDTDRPHFYENKQDGLPIVDSTSKQEYWISLYLQATDSNPLPYTWNYQLNELGTIELK